VDQLERVIREWGMSLCQEIELAVLISRNPTAHK
jgi:hypothetical protein